MIYVASPGGMRKVGTVTVTMLGFEANIHHTIPALYKRAIEDRDRRPARVKKPLFVTNIRTVAGVVPNRAKERGDAVARGQERLS